MRRPRLRLVLGISIPLLVVIVLLAAWAIDSSSADGKVPRNVTLAGRSVGKLPEDDLAATVADVADQYATTPVQVRTPGKTYDVSAADLGLELDQEATVKAALTLDDGRSLWSRPVVWLTSFLDERRSPLSFRLDEGQLQSALGELGGNQKPTEPKVVPTAEGFAIVSGAAGKAISADGVGPQLLRRARSGELPLVVEAKVVDEAPQVSDEQAQSLADELTLGTAKGLQVKTGDTTVAVPAATVRSWIGSKIDDGKLVATIDSKRTVADLAKLLPKATEAKSASFTVENGAVKLIPAVTGTTCCAADTPQRVLAAITSGTGSVEVELEVDEPDLTTEEAQKLGIKEPVGTTVEWKGVQQVKSFTTYHPCCAARVTNIHRMADIVRGTLVMPKEHFSINDVVGQRTEAKGFVSAGAIANGEHVDEVGGGVSQFATTMFNAAFFAGLPINSYQMHSEHFDRYPYGREATMGYPAPDMAWTNNTPYGILVWTSYTDTSITITLYSTQYAYGEQTGQSTGTSGTCTTVTTTRTIHHHDGSTSQDTFHGRYRQPGRTTC